MERIEPNRLEKSKQFEEKLLKILSKYPGGLGRQELVEKYFGKKKMEMTNKEWHKNYETVRYHMEELHDLDRVKKKKIPSKTSPWGKIIYFST